MGCDSNSPQTLISDGGDKGSDNNECVLNADKTELICSYTTFEVNFYKAGGECGGNCGYWEDQTFDLGSYSSFYYSTNDYFNNFGEIFNQSSGNPNITIQSWIVFNGTVGGDEYNNYRDFQLDNRCLFQNTDNVYLNNVFKSYTLPASGIRFKISQYFEGDLDWNSETNVNIKFRIKATVRIQNICLLSSNFRSTRCEKWCSAAPSNCITPLISYCFDETKTGAQFLSSSKFFQSNSNGDFCRETFDDYFANRNTIISPIQSKFNTYCSTRLNTYVNDASFLSTRKKSGLSDVLAGYLHDMCGCRGPQSYYDNFFNSFINIYNASSINVGNRKCIFPLCSSTKYRPSEIINKSECPSAQCIGLISINNSGTINADQIDITNTIGECSKFQGLTKTPDATIPPTDEPGEETSGEGNLGLIIGLIILGLIFLIAIVGVVIYFFF
jgi:hypothetical protein